MSRERDLLVHTHYTFVVYNSPTKKHKGYKMKKITLSALLLGATLFVGLGATSLSAMGDDAAKCGKAMQMPSGKCGADKKVACPSQKDCEAMLAKCADQKDCEAMKAKCANSKDCNVSKKCGAEQKTPPPAMKCGAGKCGGNK